ncbi:acyl carrier protein [Dactylosporangium sp. NBC_01737]|jgi:acyl carrier protein|uniref:acyl carrier protein n=1 Tax=Dactylosporangium sp. NBC_01737 TaxID=2975959 RepID=UPI002E0EA962|nr:acyl carrier protein [Dactylosporangium sp. NBC_01737]
MTTLLPYVTEVVSGRLGRPVAPGEPLLDQPGFDSLAIAAVIDRIEADLGIELEPDLLVPETFTDLVSLAEAVRASTPAAGGA